MKPQKYNNYNCSSSSSICIPLFSKSSPFRSIGTRKDFESNDLGADWNQWRNSKSLKALSPLQPQRSPQGHKGMDRRPRTTPFAQLYTGQPKQQQQRGLWSQNTLQDWKHERQRSLKGGESFKFKPAQDDGQWSFGKGCCAKLCCRASSQSRGGQG